MSTTVKRPPADPSEAEALIREARSRQRRRYLGAGAAVLAVFAASWAALAGGGGGNGRHGGTALPRPVTAASSPAVPQARPIPGQVGTSLLMWPQGGGGPGESYVDDLSTGQVSLSERPDISVGDYQPLVITTSGYLVYVGNGATAIRDDLQGRPRVLGRTPFFAPAAKPGYVWLEYPGGVRLIPVAGGPAGPLITLPHGTRLIAGMDTGLLLDSRDGGPELWAPGSTPRILPHAAHSYVYQDAVDVTSRLVAYGSRCRGAVVRPIGGVASGFEECRMLRVFDAVTGRVRSVASPRGHRRLGSRRHLHGPGDLAQRCVGGCGRGGTAGPGGPRAHLRGPAEPQGRAARDGRPRFIGPAAEPAGVVGSWLVASLPGPRLPALGLSGNDRFRAALPRALLPVHRHGRAAYCQKPPLASRP